MSESDQRDENLLSPKCCGGWMLPVFVVGGGYLLDQATKLWTVRHLALGDHISVIPQWFDWVHFSNTGAAFGVLQDNNLFFIGLSAVALVGLILALLKRVFPGRLNYWALLLLMSGVLGNGTDRLVHGYVVDFLLFDLGFPPANPWPAFNVADSCICVAVALLLLASLQEEITRRKSNA
ncbi:MAG: signal peptidase II [Verrucomicrobiota bacterium]